MLLQGKINRAFKKLHEESDHPEVDHFEQERKQGRMKMEDPEERRRREALKRQQEEERPELEKGDFLAMVLAALLTILPVAIIVLVVIALIGYFFLMH